VHHQVFGRVALQILEDRFLGGTVNIDGQYLAVEGLILPCFF